MAAGIVERAKPRVSYVEQRQQVLAACTRLEAAGYIVGTYGNVSVRVPRGFIVTPSRVAYAALRPQDLVLVSMQGEVLEGERLPSSEMHTHRLIYSARSNVGAVVHTHSLHATAISCMHATIPVLAEEQAHLVGGEISCTRYVPGINHIELAEEIAGTLGDRNSVLVSNHGAISCGRDLEEAIVTCQVTERAAQMYLLIRACGCVVPLGAEYVALERDHYLYNYGEAHSTQRHTARRGGRLEHHQAALRPGSVVMTTGLLAEETSIQRSVAVRCPPRPAPGSTPRSSRAATYCPRLQTPDTPCVSVTGVLPSRKVALSSPDDVT